MFFVMIKGLHNKSRFENPYFFINLTTNVFFVFRFMKYCREAVVEDRKAQQYMDILLSSVEYDTFVRLMRLMRPVARAKLAAEGADVKDSPRNNLSPSKLSKQSRDDYDETDRHVSNKSYSADAKFDDDYRQDAKSEKPSK